MRSQVTPKSIRRLVSADGYLTLNMPEQAISELEKVPDAGPLEGPRRLLLGLAFKRAGAAATAIPHLEQAARLMPKPIRSFAWSELAGCYRDVGNQDLADLAERLGGDGAYELRIALADSELNILSTESLTEVL